MKVFLPLLTLVVFGVTNEQDKRPKDGNLKVGEAAPDFNLKMLDDPEQEIQLSSFKEKKAVVLIFGSYT